MELQDAIAAFDAQLAADGRSPHTRAQYARHAAALGRWLARTERTTDLAQLDHRALAAFVASPEARCRPDGVAKKATSTNALRTSLRTLFGYLADAGLMPANPARLLKRARCSPPPPRALREDEERKLLDHLAAEPGDAARRDEMLVRLMLGAGLRIGAAIGIDIEDLDLPHAEVRIRRDKNDRSTTVLLSPDLVNRLRAFLAGRRTGPLFASADGSRITVRHAQRRFAQVVAAARLDPRVSAHACRHTFATRLLERTGNLQLVRVAMRHASIASTVIYAQTDDAAVRQALSSR
ncbi:MAG: tyrosine-type recombinase/integrase [Planctomycetes bacterium]|nr:tyrosine-type recombinase/integrase [Planctomycetota bacterium]